MTDTTASPTGGGTNRAVASHATKPEELPLDRVSLIGIMGKPEDKSALFRLSRGEILRVKVGDQTQFGLVAEITDAGVVLTRNTGKSIFVPPIPVG